MPPQKLMASQKQGKSYGNLTRQEQYIMCLNEVIKKLGSAVRKMNQTYAVQN
jgi:hypothetical protein